ncbi:preprotein translocase subunit YajC [Modestobacter sp. I12A-02628]|uniref:Preprotein translocase subunit YajC n=1 Tax=Goekera deserti TaxID=2497753 RepID=A0A7K3WCU2_9ACTN|nr:preprotein translocase subunit YajC [Goekera deserti]MPQ99187.1 preprotein translocase subunit YajC [Goekera deserti]NDI47522.1 preprotein translocase subunit YajC [Goekera deserti]NEL53333.1 preprotein translocase subunit YajC [Goekera deserti]
MDSLFPLLVIVLAFALLVVLPARQRKKMAARAQELQESLTIGTPVMLTSGIHGTVAELGDGTIGIEVSPGVVLTVVRAAVLEVRPQPGAAPDRTADLGDDVPSTGGSTGLDRGPDPTDRSR